MTPDYTLSSLTQPSGPRRRRTGLVVAVAVVAGVLLVASAVVVTLLLTRPSAPSRAAAAPSRTFAVDGDLTLGQGQFSWAGGSDTTCSGWQGFDDLAGGTEVVVSDSSGKSLAVGALKAGDATVGLDGRAVECTMKFHIDGVPDGVGPYGVAIGHRGVSHYSAGDLLLGIHLSLG